LEYLLVEGTTDDFVEVRLLAAYVANELRVTGVQRREHAAVEERVRGETIRVIQAALESELVDVCSFDEVTGEISDWGLATTETIIRLDADWRKLGRPPSLYEVACLRLTVEGRRLGQILASQGSATTRGSS
jgi:hypothetical protein